MQIDVSPEIAEMRGTVRAFVKNELPAWANAVDETGIFPAGLIEAFARQGFLGMRIAEEYGGAGLELSHYCMVQEEISRAHTMFSLLMSSSGGLAPMAIQRHGTEVQKRKYLPLLTSGKARTSFALTQSEAGSDSASIRTRAEPRSDGRWVLNGIKHFISCADVTDVIMVVTVTDPAKRSRGGFTTFLIERNTPGMQVTRVDHTMGSAAWTLAELTFTDCVIKSDAAVGPIGRGFNIAMESLNEGRLSIASICLGAAGPASRSRDGTREAAPHVWRAAGGAPVHPVDARRLRDRALRGPQHALHHATRAIGWPRYWCGRQHVQALLL